MDITEESRAAKEAIQAILKSKKIIRMYPSNNPVYAKTLEEGFARFRNFFFLKDELSFKIRQNEILCGGEPVYANPEKEDNLALFFFKDGVREITFRKGLTFEELEDFFKILSLDFEREVLDDDIVTLLWERDFQNIQYVVDEAILADEEDYEQSSVMQAKEESNQPDNLLQAYEDAFKEEEAVGEVSIVPLTDKDLQALMGEIERNARVKTGKLIDLLFEMMYMAEMKQDLFDAAALMGNAVEYAIRKGDIDVVTDMLGRVRQIVDDGRVDEEIRRHLGKIIAHAGSDEIVKIIGDILDSGQEFEEGIIEGYVKQLDKNAITPFMNILGELKTIHARKVVIDALIRLGPLDILALSKGLTDERWYVVRNIIYILRKIADKRALEHLIRTVRHGDVRVKKEVIRALGEMGGAGVLLTLKECLDDPDPQVRVTALKALASLGSEAAKRIVMDRISAKHFRDKEFDEKKEHFETLSHWRDQEVFEFLVSAVKKKTFFGRLKNDEIRSCATHALGILGNKDALPVLNRLKGSGHKLLREYVQDAVRRLELG